MRFAEGKSPEDLSPDELRRLVESAERYLEVDASPLQRVVAIGATDEAGAVRYELIALELRAAGGILHWKAHASEQVMLSTPDVIGTDDRGTAFEVLPTSGGGDKVWSGRLDLIPRPADGTTLRVEFRGFRDFGHPFAPLPEAVADARATFDVAI